MEQEQILNNSSTMFRVKEPSQYHVIIHNDDVTTMDFVTMILRTIFCKTPQEAEDLMLKVHHEGAAIAGTYYWDIAESKAQNAMTQARENHFPLLLTTEEA